jgi:two-component system, OmpR family, sensor kinase
MSRMPIRVRLTLAFALAMAVVLGATGLFLYLRLGSALDRTLNQGLRARAADVGALTQQADTGLRDARSLRRPDNGFAQVLGTSGRTIDATPGLNGGSLLTANEFVRARVRQSFFERTVGDERVRLLATPVHAQGQRLVTVVGTSLEQRADALADLRRQLLVGGPAALVLASFLGYLLAAAALRPVERMGERAATISAASPGRRLPVPAADDEIGRLGARLNDMLARLENALERERNLVSNASHELRTPLALLKTEIELALDDPTSAPVLEAALRSAAEETDRLSQLADDLLLLARADAGELQIRRSRVVVGEVLEIIATRFGRRAASAGRTIEVAAAPELEVLADRRRLEQALGNLVENALRHGRGTVKLTSVAVDGVVELHVHDEGDGFGPEFVGHAFERFSRGEASGSGGAGLGLAIVAAIAQAHGGTATAANGDGAEVVLALPVGPVRSGHAAANQDRHSCSQR